MPKLMPLLQNRFDSSDEGASRLVTIRGQGRIMRQVRAISARAGVDLWARLWQTLRSSCEKGLAMTFPQYAVSKWIGHSITVSGRHYTNDVPDELFDLAAAKVTGKAQRNAQLKALESTSNEPKVTTPATKVEARNSFVCEDLREFSETRDSSEKWRRGESNPVSPRFVSPYWTTI